jgi:hypothetical protein
LIRAWLSVPDHATGALEHSQRRAAIFRRVELAFLSAKQKLIGAQYANNEAVFRPSHRLWSCHL